MSQDPYTELAEYCRNDARCAWDMGAIDAGSDPFSFFYLPGTDPTRAHTPDDEGARVEADPREGGFAIERALSDPRALWETMTLPVPLSEAGRLVFDSKYRRSGLGGWHELVGRYSATSGPFEDSPCRLPSVRVVRGGSTIGRIPRPSEGPAYAVQFRLPEPFAPPPMAPADCSPVAPNPQCIALCYQVTTPDGGWTYERVLDAGDIPIDLLARIPGWQPSSR